MDVYSFGYLIWELATGEAVNDHDHVTIATHVQQVVHERKRPKFPDTVLPELAVSVPLPASLLHLWTGNGDGLWCGTPCDLQELACKCWEHDPEQRPCDQYVLRTIDSLLDRYCSDAEHLRSHLNGVSWRDMTDTLGDMLTKGTANMENGYVVPTTVPNTPASIDMSPLILAGSSRRISLSPLGCSGVSLVPAMPSLSREGSVKGNNYMMPLVEMKNLAGLPSDKA